MIDNKKTKAIIAGAVIAAAVGLGINNIRGIDFIEPLVFNGQTIQFPYTDENSGEELLIKTDQQTYSSWDEAWGYAAIKNNSATDQNVQVQFLDNGKGDLGGIFEYLPQQPYLVSVNDYGKQDLTCDKGDWVQSTSTTESFLYNCGKKIQPCDSVTNNICTQNYTKIGKHDETKYRDEWSRINFKAIPDAISKVKPSVESNDFKVTRQIEYWIPSGSTKYFRFKLKFGLKSTGQFLIKAVGSAGSYGVLDPWYNSSWGYRMPITIDYTKIGTTTAISNFPVLISTTTANLKYTGSGGHVGKSDGTDMVVTSSDGTTKLSHEIERYSSTTGETVLWVKYPSTMSTSSNMTLYLYYGNSGASDQQDRVNVWDSNYLGVWHLNESTGQHIDSTSNASNSNAVTATNQGSTTYGKIGAGDNMAGAGDYFKVATSTALDAIGNDNVFSYSAWVYSSGYRSGSYVFKASTQYGGVGGVINVFGSNRFDLSGGNGSYGNAYATNVMSANTWHHLVGNNNGSGGSNGSVYVDGVIGGVTGAGTSFYGVGFQSQLYFGGDAGSYGIGGYFDEVRISKTVRSAAWILTEYNNQISPGTFLSYSAEESNSSPTTSTRRNIIINDN